MLSVITNYFPIIELHNEIIEPLEYLGKGSYGVAILYINNVNMKKYTCKFFYPTEKSIKNFNGEIETIRKIYELLNGCSESIVCYTDIFTIETYYETYNLIFDYLNSLSTKDNLDNNLSILGVISEYIDGFTLSKYQIHSNYECHDYLKQMFNTLQLIHSKGIVHLDIKSSNIIFNPAENKYVLIDLGIAYICDDQLTCKKNNLRGTYDFVPYKLYEKIKNGKQLNYSNLTYQDIYGVMVTFYKLINGKLPFDKINIDNNVFNDESKYYPSESGLEKYDEILNYFFYTYLDHDDIDLISEDYLNILNHEYILLK